MKIVLPQYYFCEPLGTNFLVNKAKTFPAKPEIVGDAVEGLQTELLYNYDDDGNRGSPPQMEMLVDNKSFFVVWPDETTGSWRELVATSASHCGCIKLVSKSADGKSRYFNTEHFLPPKKTLQTTEMINTSTDIHTALHIQSWPPDALEWITRERQVNWPSQATIESIISAGCHAVPHLKSSSDPKHDFVLHFGVAERILSNDLSPHQKYCFSIFKTVVQCQMTSGASLSSYHLKMMFYYASEEIPTEMWKINTGACLLYMLGRLLDCLKDQNLPHYFICGNNLIDHYSETEIRDITTIVEAIRKCPIESLWFLAEAHNLPDTEMVELLIADFEPYKSYRNLGSTAQEVFLPIITNNIRSQILQGQYNEAVDMAKNAYHEFVHMFTQLSFGEILMWIISGGPAVQVWWFSLTADLTAGTHMLQNMSVGQTQLLKDILDDCEDNELGNIVIPVSLLTPNPAMFAYDLGVTIYYMNRFSDSAYCFRGAIRLFKKIRETVKETIDSPTQDTEKKLNYENMLNQQIVINTMWLCLTWLWYVYCATGQQTRFTEYMDDMDNICEHLGQSKYYTEMARIWDELGYEGKAAEVRRRQGGLD